MIWAKLVAKIYKFGEITTFGLDMGQNQAEPVQTHVELVQCWTIDIGSGSEKWLRDSSVQVQGQLNGGWTKPDLNPGNFKLVYSTYVVQLTLTL